MANHYSEAGHYYEACQLGLFARENAAECGCRGYGWFLSEVDTFHECPLHYEGQPHPEECDRDESDAPEAELPEMEPVPFMIATDDHDDGDIPF